MGNISAAGVFSLGGRTVNGLGYGAMQLAGPGVFGPPKIATLKRTGTASRSLLTVPALRPPKNSLCFLVSTAADDEIS